MYYTIPWMRTNLQLMYVNKSAKIILKFENKDVFANFLNYPVKMDRIVSIMSNFNFTKLHVYKHICFL